MVNKLVSVIQKPKVDFYKPIEKTTQPTQNNSPNSANNSAAATNEFRSRGEMLAFSLTQKFTAQTQGLYNPNNIREDVVQQHVEYALSGMGGELREELNSRD